MAWTPQQDLEAAARALACEGYTPEEIARLLQEQQQRREQLPPA